MKPLSALLVALPVSLVACTPPPAPPAPPKIVRVFSVGEVGGAGSVQYSGEVRARYEPSLGFRIPGKLVERLVDAGAVVSAGQPLARLDAGDTGLQLAQAEAQRSLAEADAKRFRELKAQGYVSQALLDAREVSLKSAEAQAGLAANQNRYTTLVADRTGVISATTAEPGQVLAVGQPVVRLASDGHREIALAVPESVVSRLRSGLVAEVTLWVGDVAARAPVAAPSTDGAGANKAKAAPRSADNMSSATMVQSESDQPVHLAGRVREVAAAADPVTRTYAVRVSLADAPARLPIGLSASVRFPSLTEDAALQVPIAAIYQKGSDVAVWIIGDDQTVRLKPVELAGYVGNSVRIKTGLVAGERIVAAGVQLLSEGQKVRLGETVK